jgi:hypothetical protein
VLKCEQLYVGTHCHGGALCWMSAFHAFCSEWPYAIFLVFHMQYTSDFIVVPCCMNSTISTPFLSQKTVAISFLADKVCLNFFCLFCWICVHLLLWLLFGFSIHKWKVSSPVTRIMWLRDSSPSLWYRCRKVKAEAILCILYAPVNIFGTHLGQNLW